MLRVGPRSAIVVGLLVGAGVLSLGLQQAHAINGACNIKGNISIGGERIYHMPGQKYYSETRINTRSGERWFCSEDEARAAGWRKSKH